MGAMNFVTCFVALCALIGVTIVVASVQRTMRNSAMAAHQEKLESMRLAATKEITVSPKQDRYSDN
jgi:hypothetical protein